VPLEDTVKVWLVLLLLHKYEVKPVPASRVYVPIKSTLFKPPAKIGLAELNIWIVWVL